MDVESIVVLGEDNFTVVLSSVSLGGVRLGRQADGHDMCYSKFVGGQRALAVWPVPCQQGGPCAN